MKCTQVYLDDQLWEELHARARQEKTTISELVRQAVRERYFSKLEKRRRAMMAFVGSRKGPFTQTVEEDRQALRKNDAARLKRLDKQWRS